MHTVSSILSAKLQPAVSKMVLGLGNARRAYSSRSGSGGLSGRLPTWLDMISRPLARIAGLGGPGGAGRLAAEPCPVSPGWPKRNQLSKYAAWSMSSIRPGAAGLHPSRERV